MLTVDEKRRRQREASRRWKERNPEKAKASEKRRAKRIHDTNKSKLWRKRRLALPGYRERINRQTNARITAIRGWLSDYKLSKGCVDCGYKEHPHALHFDHIFTDKSLNVCNAKSIEQAQREIAKCEVRCANCHAIKTEHRRRARKLV